MSVLVGIIVFVEVGETVEGTAVSTTSGDRQEVIKIIIRRLILKMLIFTFPYHIFLRKDKPNGSRY